MKFKINKLKRNILIGICCAEVVNLWINVNSLGYYSKNIPISHTEENIDITNRVIVKSFGGSNYESSSSGIRMSDGGYIVISNTTSTDAGFENKGGYDSFIIKYSSNGEQEWIKGFGGSSTDILYKGIEASDGGIIVVGYSASPNAGFSHKGNSDAILIKYSSNGEQEWIKDFGGSNGDTFDSIFKTSDGGFIVTGSISSKNIGLTINGSSDTIIVKYNSSGEKEWFKNFGGSSNDSGSYIIETSDGGYLIVGQTFSTIGSVSGGNSNGLVVKCDSKGNQEWIKAFGGSGYDIFESAIEMEDGSFIAVGYSGSTNAGYTNKGQYDGILVKYNKDGNQEWIKVVGGSGHDQILSVQKDEYNNILVSGSSSSLDMGFSNNGGTDAIIVKCDLNGNQLWIKNFGGSGSDTFSDLLYISEDEFIGIGETTSNNIGVKIKGSNDGLIIKYNKECKENESLFLNVNNFDKNISNDDRFSSVTELSDGSYVAVGYSYSNNIGFDNNGGSDAILVKYSKSGTVEWIKNFGGSGNDGFNYIVKTGDGGFITAGYSYSTDTDYINKGNADAVIVKYNKDGEKEWIKSFGGSNNETFYSIKETSDKGFIAVGYSESSNAGFNSKGSGDAVIVKYSSNGEQEWIKSFGGSKEDYFRQTIETSDGGFAVIGYSESTNAGFTNKGVVDAVIIKYDKDGNQEWIKSFGGSLSNPSNYTNYDYFMDIIESYDNSFIVVGSSNSSDAGFSSKGWGDAIIVKYDSSGNQQWIKSFGGSSSDYFYSVVETSDKGFMVFGHSNSEDGGFDSKGSIDAIVVKYDLNGNQLWIKNFGGSSYDYIYSGIETRDENIVIVGESASTFDDYKNTGGRDTFILKYDSNGNQIWIESTKIKVKNTQEDYDNIRYLINKIKDEEVKKYLNEKLNSVPLNLELELKNGSANLDVYIKSENMLLMNLSTNSITFNDYSGLNEIEQQNAVEISINSSLPYQLNAYLLEEMYNNDKTKKIDMDRLQIKDNTEDNYSEFVDINEKLVLKDSCESGNDKSHSIDLKLKGGNAYESDIYKTVIKFEAEQK